MSKELGYLLGTSYSGISVYEGSEAKAQKVMDWLVNPEGSIADNPAWGNPLHLLKFEPIDSDLDVIAELMIAEKLERDIDINITSVKVEYISIDEIKISISDTEGQISMNIPN